MDGSSLFLSTCSRRELARRRAVARSWRSWYLRRPGLRGRLGAALPSLVFAGATVAAGVGAFLVGRGGL